MKHKYYLITLFAAIVLMTGCKKEQDYVTLGAIADHPGKAYIDNNNYPCWHNGDKVYINNDTYSISGANGHSAQIERVVADDAYRAIYPATLVAQGSSIGSLESVPITLPSTQVYELDDDGHQRVSLPMGAYITNGTTLQFYNLCSVVRVTVSNQLSTDLSLSGIIIEAEHAMLSGQGTATVSGQSTDHIAMSNTAKHSVQLNFSGTATATVNVHGNKPFDIVVPAFATDIVTITLITTDGKYCELPLTGNGNGVTLANNTVTTVTVNVTELNLIPAAELVAGSTFNDAIPATATSVVFEYNSSVSSGTLLSTTDSPVPIYGNLDDRIWRVSTSATIINATDCSNMFYSKGYLTSIEFGSGFNTSNVTNMLRMFAGCFRLTSLDLSNFNTSNVTSMEIMFSRCFGLTSLDVSNFNTENVTYMGHMFSQCQSLTSLDVSNFNTENVTYMTDMFFGCSSLISLDLSNFNTSNVTSMERMFLSCRGLTNLDVSNFSTENVANMDAMFADCRSLTSLDVSNFNTSNVTYMSMMFYNCSGLTSLDVSNFNTRKVMSMSSMFYGCNGLTSLDLSNFNTRNLMTMNSMFYGCSGLTSLNVSSFNTVNVRDMSSVFYNCSSLTCLDLHSFNTYYVGDLDISNMFYNCSRLTSLDLSSFDMSNVVDKGNMCYNLSTTSRYCTITCPASVQTELENGTNLPTSGVTFTWVRPSSSK